MFLLLTLPYMGVNPQTHKSHYYVKLFPLPHCSLGGKKTSSDRALYHFSSQAVPHLGPQLSSGAAGVWSCSAVPVRAASFSTVYWNFPHPEASLYIILLPAPIVRLFMSCLWVWVANWKEQEILSSPAALYWPSVLAPVSLWPFPPSKIASLLWLVSSYMPEPASLTTTEQLC